MGRKSQRNGEALEQEIELTNNIYSRKGLARVDKVPTPWVVNRQGARVKYAYPQKKGTVDFVGLIQGGRKIAFDAKTTTKPSLPLDMIEEHQLDYLDEIDRLGGVAFLIVDFSTKGRRFFLPVYDLKIYWANSLNGGRKSIPFKDFENGFPEIRSENGVAAHYLKHIEGSA